jgi:hypothetical protein
VDHALGVKLRDEIDALECQRASLLDGLDLDRLAANVLVPRGR